MKKIYFFLFTLLPLFSACQSGKEKAFVSGTVDQWSPTSHLFLSIMADDEKAVMAEIPVGELSKGCYIAQVRDNYGHSATCKFVK